MANGEKYCNLQANLLSLLQITYKRRGKKHEQNFDFTNSTRRNANQ